MKPSLIVYYSLTGNVADTAERIAQKIDADLLRLQPKEDYPAEGVRKFLWGGKSAVMGEEPPLEPYEFNAENYDRSGDHEHFSRDAVNITFRFKFDSGRHDGIRKPRNRNDRSAAREFSYSVVYADTR